MVMKRADLQKLAKEHGIKANKSNMQLIEELRKLGVILDNGGGGATATDKVEEEEEEEVERADETAAVPGDTCPASVTVAPPACVSVMADGRSADEKLDHQKVDDDDDNQKGDNQVDNEDEDAAKQADNEVDIDSVVARCNDDGMAQAPTVSTLSRGRSEMTIQQQQQQQWQKQWPQPQSRRVEDMTYPHFSAPTLDEYEQHRLQLQAAGFTTLFSPASVTKSVAMTMTNARATRAVRPIEWAEKAANANVQHNNTTAVEVAADVTHTGMDETTSVETDPFGDDGGADVHGTGAPPTETDPKLLQEKTTNIAETTRPTLPNGSVSKIGKPPRLAGPSASGGMKRQTSTASSKFNNAKSSKIHRK